jgi:hypothetical protein
LRVCAQLLLMLSIILDSMYCALHSLHASKES